MTREAPRNIAKFTSCTRFGPLLAPWDVRSEHHLRQHVTKPRSVHVHVSGSCWLHRTRDLSSMGTVALAYRASRRRLLKTREAPRDITKAKKTTESSPIRRRSLGSYETSRRRLLGTRDVLRDRRGRRVDCWLQCDLGLAVQVIRQSGTTFENIIWHKDTTLWRLAARQFTIRRRRLVCSTFRSCLNYVGSPT